jgi:hypothetical protein
MADPGSRGRTRNFRTLAGSGAGGARTRDHNPYYEFPLL